MRKKLQILLFYLMVFAANAFAGWSDNMRLTYGGNEISPQIIARNDTVHIIWYSQLENNVCYIRSTDGGNTWGIIINLNLAGHTGGLPILNLSDNGLLATWADRDTLMPFQRIGLRKSTNSGTTWNTPQYIHVDHNYRFTRPVSAVKGDSIFIAYFSYENDSTGHSPFKSMHSYDYGQTWSDEVTVGYPYVLIAQPNRMEYCGGTLLLAWAGTADPARINEVHIYGYRSTDAGSTWSDTIWISLNTPNWSLNTCIACNKQTSELMVGYMDYRFQVYSFYGDIFISTSDDNGISWPFESQVTAHHTASWPSIFCLQDTFIAAWDDIQFNVDGYPEIMFNRSNDGGHTWQGEYRITYTERESGAANVYMDNSNIYLVWVEDFPGYDLDLVFKKFTPDSTDAVENNEIPIPVKISLSAYPNPFNSASTITLTGAEQAEIGIYDITGRLITTLHTVGGQALWDASAYSSCLYFARVAGEQATTLKLVLVK